MTARRLFLAAAVVGIVASSGTAAFAGGVGTETQNKRVCVVTTDDPTTSSWDGICVVVPIR
jgi:hypothetical protein